MYIQHNELRNLLKIIIQTRSKNQIVEVIKGKGYKFQQYNLDNFLKGSPVSLDTLIKLDLYVRDYPL